MIGSRHSELISRLSICSLEMIKYAIFILNFIANKLAECEKDQGYT